MNRIKNDFTVSIFLVILIIVTTLSVTFAYFKAVINSTNSSIDASGSSANVSLTFANGSSNETILGDKIIPGWSDIKKFTITGVNTNANNKDLAYDILMVVDANTFDSGELLYDLEGNGYTISNQKILSLKEITNNRFSLFPSGTSLPVVAGATSSVTHSYTLTIKYPDLEDVPQYVDGKVFAAHIIVESSSKITRS